MVVADKQNQKEKACWFGWREEEGAIDFWFHDSATTRRWQRHD
jgi:hypothetical protein